MPFIMEACIQFLLDERTKEWYVANAKFFWAQRTTAIKNILFVCRRCRKKIKFLLHRTRGLRTTSRIIATDLQICAYILIQRAVEYSMAGRPLTDTICEWFSYCREVCMLSMEDKHANPGKIGGPYHISTKVKRRKFYRGRVEGNWILRMIDKY